MSADEFRLACLRLALDYPPSGRPVIEEARAFAAFVLDVPNGSPADPDRARLRDRLSMLLELQPGDDIGAAEVRWAKQASVDQAELRASILEESREVSFRLALLGIGAAERRALLQAADLDASAVDRQGDDAPCPPQAGEPVGARSRRPTRGFVLSDPLPAVQPPPEDVG